MKKPFELEGAFLSLQEEITYLKKRLGKLETWEPSSVAMQIWLSSNQAVVGGAAAVPIPFDTVYYDTRSTFDLTTYVFTAPVPGIYQAITQGTITGGAGTFTVKLLHSTSTYFGEIILPLTITTYNFSHHFKMAAGDTLQVTFEATGNTTISGSTSSITTFSVSLA